MTEASESVVDQLPALLEYRNTPSEQLGRSPSELMLDRRMYTHQTADLRPSFDDA